jgi:transketolase
MFAAKYKLANLTVFVDRNNIQIDGFTHNIMPLESLSEKYKAFNWNVISIDGHNFNQILSAVESARQEYQRPTVIIAKTIPGKGVYFMENKFEWHGKVPDDAQTKEAVKLLTKQLKEYE